SGIATTWQQCAYLVTLLESFRLAVLDNTGNFKAEYLTCPFWWFIASLFLEYIGTVHTCGMHLYQYLPAGNPGYGKDTNHKSFILNFYNFHLVNTATISR